jgi:methionyl-tRNA formyltransferase
MISSHLESPALISFLAPVVSGPFHLILLAKAALQVLADELDPANRRHRSAEGLILWTCSMSQVVDHVRGMDPWPGAPSPPTSSRSEQRDPDERAA